MNRPIDRRQVLAAAAAAAVAPLGSKVLHASLLRSPAAVEHLASRDSARGTAKIAATHESVSPIGRAYLRQYPDEANPDTLLGQLPTGWAPDSTDWSELADQVAADYTSGAVITLDGWRLSRTEARAAALTLLQPT